MKFMRCVVVLPTLALFLLGPAVAQYRPEQVATEIVLKKTRFRADEAIEIDVWVRNKTEAEITRNEFSPVSSAIRPPAFVIARVPQGPAFTLYLAWNGVEWDDWYQPDASYVGSISLPPGKPILLLRGDLHLTVSRVREHCLRTLEEMPMLDQGSKDGCGATVRSADDFLRGGAFDIHVRAYSDSPAIRIEVEGQNSQP